MNHHSSRRNLWHGRSNNSKHLQADHLIFRHQLTSETTTYTGTARKVINAAQKKLRITFPKRIKSDSIPVSVMTPALSQNLYDDWPNTTFLSRCWQFLLTTNLIWKTGKLILFINMVQCKILLSSPLLEKRTDMFFGAFSKCWEGGKG